MKAFIINIPTSDMVESYRLCYEVAMNYFQRHNIDVFVLEKNDFDVDPSWLKLKCFDYVDDDFVLCWDIDLLPRNNCPSIVSELNFSKINLVVDSIFYTKSAIPPPVAPYHRYNCGLMGIPRSYKPLLEKVFLESKISKLPSYEQYPMNLELSKNQYKDVHELDKTWNCIFHFSSKDSFMASAKAVHYTGDRTVGIRDSLIKAHHRLCLP